MKAEGGDLQYATLPEGLGRQERPRRPPDRPGAGRAPRPAAGEPGAAGSARPAVEIWRAGPRRPADRPARDPRRGRPRLVGLRRLARSSRSRSSSRRRRPGGLPAPQDDLDPDRAGGRGPRRRSSPRPRSSGSRSRSRSPAGSRSRPTATIPLGSLRDIKGYAFQGRRHAQGGLDRPRRPRPGLGPPRPGQRRPRPLRLPGPARRPARRRRQEPARRRPPSRPEPGALPPGGFRANLRAAISPEGPADGRDRGASNSRSASCSPRSCRCRRPLSGELTLKAEAKGDLAKLADPKAWPLDGQARQPADPLSGGRPSTRSPTEVHVKDGPARRRRLRRPARAASP